MGIKRLSSSAVIIVVMVGLLIIGGLPLALAMGIISIIGLKELYRAAGFHRTGVAYLCYILSALYSVMIYFIGLSFFTAFVFIIIATLALLYVLTFPRYNFKEIAIGAFGLFYVTFSLSFIFLTRVLGEGGFLAALILISAWGSDTLAYLAGMLFGKHKMAPVLSPKKTVEGFIGGIIGAMIVAVLFVLIFKEHYAAVFSNPYLAVCIICLIASVLSVAGDLVASAIKRNNDIKDFGTLIPGHGGILDRFDSIIIAAPLVFFGIMFLKMLGA